jgi:hypothetical protein
LAGVQCHTHWKVGELPTQGELGLDGGRERVARVDEHGDHAVTLALLLRPLAAVSGNAVVEDLVVARHEAGHLTRCRLPRLRRAFDVREQKGDDAGWQRVGGGRHPVILAGLHRLHNAA